MANPQYQAGKGTVFDTMQVLPDHARLSRDQLDEDGAWRRNAYLDHRHTYNTGVAWAMLEFNDFSPNPTIEQAARKNLDWTLTQEKNRYLESCACCGKTPRIRKWRKRATLTGTARPVTGSPRSWPGRLWPGSLARRKPSPSRLRYGALYSMSLALRPVRRPSWKRSQPNPSGNFPSTRKLATVQGRGSPSWLNRFAIRRRLSG